MASWFSLVKTRSGRGQPGQGRAHVWTGAPLLSTCVGLRTPDCSPGGPLRVPTPTSPLPPTSRKTLPPSSGSLKSKWPDFRTSLQGSGQSDYNTDQYTVGHPSQLAAGTDCYLAKVDSEPQQPVAGADQT